MARPRVSRARAPISRARPAHSAMATEGVRSSRGSRKAISLSFLSSFTSLPASFSSCLEKGSSRQVVKMLKMEWHTAMPAAEMGSPRKSKPTMALAP